MLTDDYYKQVTIAPGHYCNKTELIGFKDVDQRYDNETPYYPHTPEHNALFATIEKNLQTLQKEQNIVTGSLKLQMPYDRFAAPTHNQYIISSALQKLTSTWVTYWLAPKANIQTSSSNFFINNGTIQSLQTCASHYPNNTLISNGGFFVTRNLIYDNEKSKSWALHKRIDPKFYLNNDLSPFYGFYYAKQGDDVFSTFQTFSNLGLVGINAAGKIQLLPNLEIKKYRVGVCPTQLFDLNSYNDLSFSAPITLITPLVKTDKLKQLQQAIKSDVWENGNWKKYNEVIVNNRINLFINNRGTGTHPEEYVEKVWENEFPVMNFGAILSIDKAFFNEHFESVEAFCSNYLNKRMFVYPELPEHIKDYTAIYATSIEFIKNYQSIFKSTKVESIMDVLDGYDLTHPSFQLSQESYALSPVKRIPSHLLIETENYFGSILLSGRYELSIGSCLVDEINILELIAQKNLFPEAIKNAIKLDGGSGAKVVHYQNNNFALLNLPAVGSRVGFGDTNGNFYHGITVTL